MTFASIDRGHSNLSNHVITSISTRLELIGFLDAPLQLRRLDSYYCILRWHQELIFIFIFLNNEKSENTEMVFSAKIISSLIF
jgi:hypothetical protein